jgi:hypothetical protein
MDLADRLIDIIRLAKSEGWPADKLIEDAEQLYEAERGSDSKLIRMYMSRDGREDTIYSTVSKALSNSKKGDIIVLASGFYKVFTEYADYRSYITQIYDARKLGDPDEVEHSQIIPSTETQNFVIVCRKSNIDSIKTQLLKHFVTLKPNHISCIPVSDSKFCMVLKSLSGSYGDGIVEMQKFIDTYPDDSIKTRLSLIESKYDELTKKLYIQMPISAYTHTPEGLKLLDPRDIVNITNNFINVNGDVNGDIVNRDKNSKSKKSKSNSKYRKWIEDNPPGQKTIRKYYFRFVSKNGDKLSESKFASLMEKCGYEKKRTNKGFIWVENDDDSESD